MSTDCAQLRKEIIKFLAEHWRENLSIAYVSNLYGYTERYFKLMFKNMFGLSFGSYMTKLRLQRAAQMIIKKQNITEAGRMAGYESLQSFSKAFRKEIGLSPRHFLQSGMEVPDMPVCYEIAGRPLSLLYRTTENKAVYGNLVYATEDGGTSFLEAANQCADYFEGQWTQDVKRKDKIEIWWNDEKERVCRMTGRYLATQINQNVIKPIIILQQDYYAVFSVSYEEDNIDLSSIIKQIFQYVTREWTVINNKEIRRMGYLFITCEDGQVSVHIPVHKQAMGMKNQDPKFKGAAAWVQYIDDSIQQNLTVQILAETFNYSERHFTDTFEMYFGIRPGLYIKKRKLYLAAKELTQGQKNIEKIVNSYGFPSLSAFRKSFQEEFSCYPEDYKEKEYRADNLNRHYTHIKKQTRLTVVKEEDILIVGRNVSSDGSREESQGDLIESIAWFLCYDFVEGEHPDGRSEKVVVWQTDKDRIEQYCLVGQRLDREDQFDRFNPKLYEKVHITGGTYAVLETMKSSDKDTLVETYRTMYRCAFDGWLRENREKVDLTRLTFVKYKKEKLYFYIPIYA